MPQSNAIAGFIVAAFLIFIVSRGELPKYAAVFFGSADSPAPTGTGGKSDAPSAPDSSLGAAFQRVDGITKTLTGGKLGLVGGEWSPSEWLKKWTG